MTFVRPLMVIGSLPLSLQHVCSKVPCSLGRANALTQSTRPTLVPGIERIVQAVTHQIEADHKRNDRKPGPECHPWRLAEKLPGDVKHGAP